MKWLKIKMFEPSVFGYLPSSGLKMMTVRSYIYILCDSRWEKFAEHSNPAHTSEPAKHLRENLSHSFTWRVLSSAQTFHKRRIVDGLMIHNSAPV